MFENIAHNLQVILGWAHDGLEEAAGVVGLRRRGRDRGDLCAGFRDVERLVGARHGLVVRRRLAELGTAAAQISAARIQKFGLFNFKPVSFIL